MILTMVLVSLAGGIGAVLRFVISRWQGKLPWGILAANTIASAILGLFIGADQITIIVVSAFAGGLSTFSSFAAQTSQYLAATANLKAYAYVALSFAGPSTGVVLGALASGALLN